MDLEKNSLNKLMINDIERRYYSYKHINKLFIYINDIKNIYDIDLKDGVNGVEPTWSPRLQ